MTVNVGFCHQMDHANIFGFQSLYDFGVEHKGLWACVYGSAAKKKMPGRKTSDTWHVSL